MPKKVNVSSNQRIDLDDFTRAASDYTQESGNFSREQLVLARRSLALGAGFRIEISDQATSPGEFTIYNGTAVDKAGNILNNEQSAADARVLTLSGTGLEHYVEVEFVETESDVDSRAFWDPTFPGNNPPGKEFSLSVATRKTPDWQVVRPPSTSAFTVTGTVNSNRIPIAVLYTNGSGEIAGFTAVNASTVLEEDIAAPDTQLRVLDSTLFPTTGTATVGGTSISITANDRINGILTISPFVGVAKQAGDIVVETTVTAAFLPLETDALPGAPSGTESKDQRRSLFKGDEIRGSALSANPQDAAARSDIQNKSLKDYVDFLASQLRELKFGDPRSDVTEGLPPSDWSGTRYFNSAGSLAGSRLATITVGDGTLSYGDVNNAALGTAIQAAHDALDATNGGTIFVKDGDYSSTTDATLDRPVKIVFGHGVRITTDPADPGVLSIDSDDPVVIENVPATTTATLGAVFDLDIPNTNAVGCSLQVKNSILGGITIGSTVPVSSVKIDAIDSTFASVTGGTILSAKDSTGDQLSSALFRNCIIAYTGTVTNRTTSLVEGNWNGTKFVDCTFDLAVDTKSTNGFVRSSPSDGAYDPAGWEFRGCTFLDNGTGLADRGLDFIGATTATSISFKDCVFDFDWTATPALPRVINCVSVATGGVSDFFVEGCDFTPIGANEIPNTSSGSPGYIIYLDDGGGDTDEANINTVRNNLFGQRPTVTTGSMPSDFITVCYNASYGLFKFVDNHTFGFTTGVHDTQSGFCTITGNTFDLFAGYPSGGSAVPIGRDIAGIRVDTYGGNTHIADNQIKVSGKENTGFTLRGLYLEGFSASDHQPAIVANNQIDLEATSGGFVGITNPDTASGSQAKITGNRIFLGSSYISTTCLELRGIKLGDTGGGSLVEGSITNNDITLAGTSAGDCPEVYGIEVIYYTGDWDGTLTLANNNINISYGQGASTDGAGISFTGCNANITGNNVYCYGRASAIERGYGIYMTGSYISCSNNNIRLGNYGENMRQSIRYDSDLEGETYLTNPGSINIIGNNVQHGSDSIAIYANIAHDGFSSVVINNNNVRTNRTSGISSQEFDIYVNNSGSGCGGYAINGNVVTEGQQVSTGNTSANIILSGTPRVDGVSVCGNVVNSNNDSWDVERGASASAISIYGANHLSCCSNAIFGWQCTTGARRSALECSASYHFTAVGNTVDSAGTGAQSTMTFQGNDGCVSANEADGDNITTSSITTKTTNGDNHAALV